MALPDLRHFRVMAFTGSSSDPVEVLVGEAWVLADTDTRNGSCTTSRRC
jgi:hypothetical protein